MPLSVAALLAAAALAVAPTPTISLQTSPRADALRVTGQPTQFALDLRDAAGRPLDAASVEYVLRAPVRSTWLSTDMPVVEGTELLAGAARVAAGRARFDYHLPIRGAYVLDVSLVPDHGERVRRVFRLTVGERRGEARSVAVLLAALLGLGLCFGALFGRAHRERGATPRIGVGAPGLLVLLLAAGSAPAAAHEPARVAPGAVAATARDAWGVTELRLRIGRARVGVPVPVRAALVDVATGAPLPGVRWDLTIDDAEHGTRVFSSSTTSPGVEFVGRFQFTDGAPHRVSLRARREGGARDGRDAAASVELAVLVGVEAVQPPTRVVVRALVMLLAVTALGLGVGFALSVRLVPRAP